MTEREIKLTLPGRFTMPAVALDGEPLDVATLPDQQLRATYFDTADLRMARHGVTLRYRTGEAETPRWTLKLPVASRGSELERDELNFEAARREPPPEVRSLVTAYARGEPLTAVATLRTRRRRIHLIADEVPIAEVSDDEVSVIEGRRVVSRFREIEVEALADGVDLLPIADQLRTAGATESEPIPKVVRALGSRATAPSEVGPRPVPEDGRLADVVAASIADALTRIVRHDPQARLGAPEGVHQLRVAMRRLRSDLRTLGDAVDPRWREEIEPRLRAIADAAADARDADVMSMRLRAELDGSTTALAPLVETLDRKRATARERLMEALDGPEYVALLNDLVAATQNPPAGTGGCTGRRRAGSARARCVGSAPAPGGRPRRRHPQRGVPPHADLRQARALRRGARRSIAARQGGRRRRTPRGAPGRAPGPARRRAGCGRGGGPHPRHPRRPWRGRALRIRGRPPRRAPADAGRPLAQRLPRGVAGGPTPPLAEVGDVIGPPIRAAGGVVWRRVDGVDGESGVEVAIIHRPRYDDWSLPKGKVSARESDLEGAVREVLEETGYHVRVGRGLGETRYVKRDGSSGVRQKVVRWWAMQAEAGFFSATREVDDLRWLSLAEATDQLTRDTDREVLERFARGTAPTRTVLLVRHALAGTASAWAGDDRERPLDACGIEQADELVRLLSRYEVGSILSADILRCTATVRPLADALGLEVQAESLLSQVGYPGREGEAVALLRRLGDAEHDAVACGQGEVIPDLVDRMASADHYLISRPVQSRKGSTWALTIDAEGRLVAADYLEPPRPPACTGNGA